MKIKVKELCFPGPFLWERRAQLKSPMQSELTPTQLSGRSRQVSRGVAFQPQALDTRKAAAGNAVMNRVWSGEVILFNCRNLPSSEGSTGHSSDTRMAGPMFTVRGTLTVWPPVGSQPPHNLSCDFDHLGRLPPLGSSTRTKTFTCPLLAPPRRSGTLKLASPTLFFCFCRLSTFKKSLPPFLLTLSDSFSLDFLLLILQVRGHWSPPFCYCVSLKVSSSFSPNFYYHLYVSKATSVVSPIPDCSSWLHYHISHH